MARTRRRHMLSTPVWSGLAVLVFCWVMGLRVMEIYAASSTYCAESHGALGLVEHGPWAGMTLRGMFGIVCALGGAMMAVEAVRAALDRRRLDGIVAAVSVLCFALMWQVLRLFDPVEPVKPDGLLLVPFAHSVASNELRSVNWVHQDPEGFHYPREVCVFWEDRMVAVHRSASQAEVDAFWRSHDDGVDFRLFFQARGTLNAALQRRQSYRPMRPDEIERFAAQMEMGNRMDDKRMRAKAYRDSVDWSRFD